MSNNKTDGIQEGDDQDQLSFADVLELPILDSFKLYHLALIALGCFILFKLYHYSNWKITNGKVTALAKYTLDRRNSQWQKFDTTGIDVELILSLDVCKLREELIKGTFSSVDLVTVFSERCQRIGRALNLSTEENFAQALKIAGERDEELAKAKEEGKEEELGLMHGIPFSVKDLINQKGFLSTVGCAYLCNDFAKEDSVIVK